MHHAREIMENPDLLLVEVSSDPKFLTLLIIIS
jgi:hypothetical protein